VTTLTDLDGPPRAMTETEVDVMRAALEHVVRYPDEHDQELWGLRYDRDTTYDDAYDRPVPVCRTVFCLAGHVAVTVLRAQPRWAYVAPDGDARGSLQAVTPRGEVRPRDVERYARESLGLPFGRANRLFASSNSLRRVAELCYLYSDGRVDLLDRLPAPTERDVRVEREDALYAWSLAELDDRLCPETRVRA
jgi:hypothetical protein